VSSEARGNIIAPKGAEEEGDYRKKFYCGVQF
jgi:hypothetical protein